METLITELETLNDNMRKLMVGKDFSKTLEELSPESLDRLLQGLYVSVNNAKILTNNILKNDSK